MKSISAAVVDRAITRADGLTNMVCPICAEVHDERDFTKVYLEGSELHVELCDNCLTDYEFDSGRSIESDVVEESAFTSLHAWCTDNRKPSEKAENARNRQESVSADAQVAANYFGGNAWASGGGIDLILIDRPDGQLTVLSSDCACIYSSEGEFMDGQPPVHTLNFR